MLRLRVWIYVLCFFGFFAYSAWMIGPYVHSTLVRSASVTAWLRISVAPIDGKITSRLPEVGKSVADDGKIAVIQNDLLLQATQLVETLHDKVLFTKVNLDESRKYLDTLNVLNHKRRQLQDLNIQIFKSQLETKIQKLDQEIEVNRQRIAVQQRIVGRQKELADRGSGAQRLYDAALIPLGELRQQQVELKSDLIYARQRRTSAQQGVYILEDGSWPNWLDRNELELTLEIQRARNNRQNLEVTYNELLSDREKDQVTLEKLKIGQVLAPPGSTIFRVLAAPYSTVTRGDRVAEWIDCSQLLIDAPVSDSELPFIKLGSVAKILLEGETVKRDARVILTRGSTATLGHTSLAAIANGRTEGFAQVLLTLETDANPSLPDCPIGRAAHVTFPDVGVLDVIKARLQI